MATESMSRVPLELTRETDLAQRAKILHPWVRHGLPNSLAHGSLHPRNDKDVETLTKNSDCENSAVNFSFLSLLRQHLSCTTGRWSRGERHRPASLLSLVREQLCCTTGKRTRNERFLCHNQIALSSVNEERHQLN